MFPCPSGSFPIDRLHVRCVACMPAVRRLPAAMTASVMRSDVWLLAAVMLLAATGWADESPAPQSRSRHQYKPKDAESRGYVLLGAEAADAAAASRPLVVWLHPAGGFMNEELERDWWPDFEKAGCFLMLPESKTKERWVPEDIPFLMSCIDDAIARHPQISAKRVVLFGYSAGGQLALDLGRTRGERLAGIVTMAAYPFDPATRQLALPPPTLGTTLSYFLICGRKDGGLIVCRPAAAQLKKQGFQAMLREVPGIGHAFAPGEKAAVVAWAASVEQGRKPVDPYAGRASPAAETVADFQKDLLASTAAPPDGGQNVKLGETSFTLDLPPDCDLGPPPTRTPGQLLNAIRRAGGSTIGLLGIMLHDKPNVDDFLSGYIEASNLRGIAAEEIARGTLMIGERSWSIRSLLTCPIDSQRREYRDRLTIAACCPANDDRSEWLVLKFDMPLDLVEKGRTADWLHGVLASLRGM